MTGARRAAGRTPVGGLPTGHAPDDDVDDAPGGHDPDDDAGDEGAPVNTTERRYGADENPG